MKWKVMEWPIPERGRQWESPICHTQEQAKFHAEVHGPGRYAFFTQGPGRLSWDGAGMLYLPEEQVKGGTT